MIYIILAFLIGVVCGGLCVAYFSGRVIKQIRRDSVRELRSAFRYSRQLLSDKHSLQRQIGEKCK